VVEKAPNLVRTVLAYSPRKLVELEPLACTELPAPSAPVFGAHARSLVAAALVGTRAVADDVENLGAEAQLLEVVRTLDGS